jgi:hypothetical protein
VWHVGRDEIKIPFGEPLSSLQDAATYIHFFDTINIRINQTYLMTTKAIVCGTSLSKAKLI